MARTLVDGDSPRRNSEQAADLTQKAAVLRSPITIEGDADGQCFVDQVPTTIEDGAFVAKTPDGDRVTLTLDPELQVAAELIAHTVRKQELAEDIGIVVMRPDGRVLAWAEGSKSAQFCRQEIPVASLAKLPATAAALENGLDEHSLIEYPVRAEKAQNGELRFKDWDPILPGEERPEGTIEYAAELNVALARSMTALYPHMVLNHFGESPAERKELVAKYFAQAGMSGDVTEENAPIAAAGLCDTRLSVFHAARLAAAIAGDGVLPSVSMVQSIENSAGEKAYDFQRSPVRPAMEPGTAKKLREMMRMASSPFGYNPFDTLGQETGTARGAFFDGFRPHFKGLSVSTKGGTIKSVPAEIDGRTLEGFKWFTGIPQQWSRESELDVRVPADPPFVVAVLAHKPDPKKAYVCNNIGRALIEKGMYGEGTFTIPGKVELSV